MLIIIIYDWVFDMVKGYVCDLCICWVCYEVGLFYCIELISFSGKIFQYFVCQFFGQVLMLCDGDLLIFESGVILLYLGECYFVLMFEGVVDWVKVQ